MKVVLGMSGGVDSAVACYILKQQGYEVIGLTMINSDSIDLKNDVEDAKKICDRLSVPYYTVDVKEKFKKIITDRFVSDYIKGITPPPCSLCNGYIKFDMLYNFMLDNKCDKIATGHYANIKEKDGRYYILNSKNQKKDQSYMLYNLTQEELSKTIFPINDMEKEDVRSIAKELGLDVNDKKDSQDLCFMKDTNYKLFIKKYLLGENYEEKILKGELTEEKIIEMCPCLQKGKFVDKNNKILGYHDGIIDYTVGQRKGLNIAFGERKYVIDINSNTNEVILGDNEDLYNDCIVIDAKENGDIRFQKIKDLDEGNEVSCKIKVRYRDIYHDAKAKRKGDKIYVKSEDKIRAITKGQIAVCYDNDDLGILFGGVII